MSLLLFLLFSLFKKKKPLRNVNSDNGYSLYCFLNKILSNDWVNEGNGLIVILEITILPQFNFYFLTFFFFFFTNETWTWKCFIVSPLYLLKNIAVTKWL